MWDYECCRNTVQGWRRGHCYGCSVWGIWDDVPKYFEISDRIRKKYGFDTLHFEATPVHPFHGQLTYLDPCIFWETGPEEEERLRKMHKDLVKGFLDAGIYGFFRGFPEVVDPNILGEYGIFWKRIKNMVDPNHIMNPGKPPD